MNLKTLKSFKKLIPLTQCTLLVEHNFISSCRNSKRLMQTLALIFAVDTASMFMKRNIKLHSLKRGNLTHTSSTHRRSDHTHLLHEQIKYCFIQISDSESIMATIKCA